MLGQNIQYYRKRDGYTQESLAKLLKVNKRTVSAWERGKQTPERKYVDQLLNIFAISEFEFFCKVDNQDMLSRNVDRLYRLPEALQLKIMSTIAEEWERYQKQI